MVALAGKGGVVGGGRGRDGDHGHKYGSETMPVTRAVGRPLRQATSSAPNSNRCNVLEKGGAARIWRLAVREHWHTTPQLESDEKGRGRRTRKATVQDTGQQRNVPGCLVTERGEERRGGCRDGYWKPSAG